MSCFRFSYLLFLFFISEALSALLRNENSSCNVFILVSVWFFLSRLDFFLFCLRCAIIFSAIIAAYIRWFISLRFSGSFYFAHYFSNGLVSEVVYCHLIVFSYFWNSWPFFRKHFLFILSFISDVFFFVFFSPSNSSLSFSICLWASEVLLQLVSICFTAYNLLLGCWHLAPRS